jgi:hypothetical protein
MALAHLLYAGHFVPEGDYVRFDGHAPVVSRPINTDTVRELVAKHAGEGASLDELQVLPDYLVCGFGSPTPALLVVAEYAEREGATLLDLGSFRVLTPEQVRQLLRPAALLA